MKKEAKLLLDKAENSLLLCIEHFNRPWDDGRSEAVLIFLDHSFEMLLKAAILERGGRIREKRAKQTIGFDACVRRALTDNAIKFLDNDQALTLQTINGMRDAAQHHLIEVSEQILYLNAQSGITVFRDVYKDVFGLELGSLLPERVLPLSTKPITDIATLFDREIDEIKEMLRPHSRRHIEAACRIRSLAIIEGSVRGELLQPSTGEIERLGKAILTKKNWNDVFPGIASIDLTATGAGPSLDLRITKKGGIPIQIVPEGTPGAGVLAIKRVDELSFYNLGRDKLAEHVGLSGPKTTAMIRHLQLDQDPDCYKEFQIDRTVLRRYSQQAIAKIKEALKTTSIEDVWKKHGPKRSKSKR